jgi:hypothetical protein
VDLGFVLKRCGEVVWEIWGMKWCDLMLVKDFRAVPKGVY